MAKYLFRLEKMQVKRKRNLVHNEVDWDVVTFGVVVGANQFGPLKDYGSYAVQAGEDVDFTRKLRTDANQVMHALWEVGPLEAADDDIVDVGYGVVNGYHTLSSGGSTQTAVTISATTWAALVGAGAAAGGLAGAVVAAIAGGIAAVVGLFLKDVPNCDGVVGGNKRQFTGAELRRGTNNPQQMMLVQDESGNSAAPDGCGASDIVVTFSVTFLPFYSVKNFIVSKIGYSPSLPWTAGFRASTISFAPFAPQPQKFPTSLYNGPSTSVRFVIENYVSRQIS